MLTYLKTELLHQHPNNPRKSLGELVELSESIKISGILQNLTVVPAMDKIGFTVIIGHRRLAAAKLAGLAEVPCVIADMSEKEQIATMLLENMQRSDLTIYEQAGGFQMMLDFGDSVEHISTQTGFSQSTVRRRVKLLELDGDKFKESVERGATLQDFAEIEKIQDITLRNKVLDKIGTSNFNWELSNAIRKEKEAENTIKIIAVLETFATKITEETDRNLMQNFRYYYSSNQAENIEIPEDSDSTNYYFLVSQYGPIQLLKDKGMESVVESEAERLEKERIIRLQERRERLDDISVRAYEMRKEFVKNNSVGKKSARDLMELSIKVALAGKWGNFDYDLFVDILGIELDDDTDTDYIDFNAIAERFELTPERVFFIATYCRRADSEHWTYYQKHNCKHEENSDLDLIYDCLKKLGYQMSDEEQALRDGSHELFGEIE